MKSKQESQNQEDKFLLSILAGGVVVDLATKNSAQLENLQENGAETILFSRASESLCRDEETSLLGDAYILCSRLHCVSLASHQRSCNNLY